jgi:signal transduction histidine kinase
VLIDQPLRVLLLDDSEADAALVVRELSRAGFVPSWERVESAAALEEALRRGGWDLVLSDYAMPSFTGVDALRIVQASGADVPFIIVSGTIGEDVAVDAMLAGAHDFMVKGRLARLGPAIHREIREARIRRERLVERARAEAERDRLIAELREAVQARDTFLSLASHELKTPLTSMMLHIQGLQRPHRSGSLAAIPFEQIEARIDTIARQALRLASLTKNLLDVARITSGRLVLHRESLDLAALVHEIVDQQKELGDPSSLVNLHATPAIGSWDRMRLETVVANLLSNAVKFGEGQPIEVVVADKSRVAEVRVRDHGIGITPEVQARIFEKFERAVPAEHYGGLGLGLWIARQIVEAHAGSITVASEPGRGSTFVVRLPKEAPPP